MLSGCSLVFGPESDTGAEPGPGMETGSMMEPDDDITGGLPELCNDMPGNIQCLQNYFENKAKS